MSEAFEDRYAALMDRLVLSRHHPTSVIACQAAAAATMPFHTPAAAGPYATGLDAVELLPATATPFERGLACGIAMMLITEKTSS